MRNGFYVQMYIKKKILHKVLNNFCKTLFNSITLNFTKSVHLNK